MQIPQSQNLHSQSFLSDKIEFVWHFYRTSGFRDQIVFGVTKRDGCYIECGLVDSNDNYVDTPLWISNVGNDMDFSIGVYNNLITVKDLIPLATDCLEFLKEI